MFAKFSFYDIIFMAIPCIGRLSASWQAERNLIMKKLLVFFLSLSTAVFFAAVLSLNSVGALAVLPTDTAVPRSGCTFLGIEGKYITQIQESIDRINEIRLEACKEGVRSPITGEPLTMEDYSPIKWSSDLEYIARLRAAEASVTMDHARTNGQSIWFDSPNGISSRGEVIAWNWSSTMTMGIDQWYGEKTDWVNNTGGVTGHYTAMINPNNHYVGLGTFISELTSYPNTTVGEFCGYSYGEIDTTRGSATGKIIQTLEVLEGNISYSIGGTDSLYISASVTFTDYWSGTLTTDGLVLVGESADNVKWSSSDNSIVTVSYSGKLTRAGCGSASVTATLPNGTALKKSVFYDHSFESSTTPATCKDEGKIVKKCKICGHTETQIIPKTNNHTYETTTIPATCKDEGRIIKKCKVCGHTETQTIPKTDTHTYETIDTTAPTCISEGETVKKCRICGHTETETIPKTGHSFGAWVIVKQPTEDADGIEERTCTVCKTSETRAVQYNAEDNTETADDEDKPTETTAESEITTDSSTTDNTKIPESDSSSGDLTLTAPETDGFPIDDSTVGTANDTDRADKDKASGNWIPIVVSVAVGAGCVGLAVVCVRKFRAKNKH